MDTEETKKQLIKNLNRIRERIENSAISSGRDPGDISLLPATKYADLEIVNTLVEIGLRDFGENQVKQAEMKAKAVGPGVSFHMIGHLQRNKVKRAVKLFKSIHSVDSLRLARDISSHSKAKSFPILIEVNIGGEKNKYGFTSEEVLPALKELSDFPALIVKGFMTVLPYLENPEDVRPYCSELRRLRDKARQQKLGDGKLDVLSMGMSHDFEIAIQEGATIVRIGSALFRESE